MIVWAVSPQATIEVLQVAEILTVAHKPISSEDRAQKCLHFVPPFLEQLPARGDHAVRAPIGIGAREILYNFEAGLPEAGDMVSIRKETCIEPALQERFEPHLGAESRHPLHIRELIDPRVLQPVT